MYLLLLLCYKILYMPFPSLVRMHFYRLHNSANDKIYNCIFCMQYGSKIISDCNRISTTRSQFFHSKHFTTYIKISRASFMIQLWLQKIHTQQLFIYSICFVFWALNTDTLNILPIRYLFFRFNRDFDFEIRPSSNLLEPISVKVFI